MGFSLRDLLFSRTTDRGHVTLSQGDRIEADEHYVTIKIRSARIVNVRKGWNKFYPCVYSTITLFHDKEAEEQISSIVRPSALGELDASNLDKVIVHDRTVVDAIAYKGGPISIELGVCAVKSTNLARPYLQLLEQIANVSGIGVVQGVRPFVGILGKGVELLLNMEDDVAVEVGLYAEVEPVEGLHVIIDKERETLDISQLSVGSDDGRLLYGGSIFDEAAYCVFEVKAHRTKYNWRRVPALNESVARMNAALAKNNMNEAEYEVKAFRRLVLLSPDLVTKDAKRLAQIWKEKFEAIEQVDLAQEARIEPFGSIEDIVLYPEARQQRSDVPS